MRRSAAVPKAIERTLQQAGRDRVARRVILLDIHDDNLISVQHGF